MLTAATSCHTDKCPSDEARPRSEHDVNNGVLPSSLALAATHPNDRPTSTSLALPPTHADEACAALSTPDQKYTWCYSNHTFTPETVARSYACSTEVGFTGRAPTCAGGIQGKPACQAGVGCIRCLRSNPRSHAHTFVLLIDCDPLLSLYRTPTLQVASAEWQCSATPRLPSATSTSPSSECSTDFWRAEPSSRPERNERNLPVRETAGSGCAEASSAARGPARRRRAHATDAPLGLPTPHRRAAATL